MAIDLEHETPIPLGTARTHRLLSAIRKGGGVNFVTILNWTRRGVRGIKLESVRVGATICTSEPALIRFIERLSGPAETGRTERRARTEHERAKQALKAAGI